MKKYYKKVVSVMLILALSLSAVGFGVCNVSAEEEDFGCRAAFADFYKESFENSSDDFWVSYSTTDYYCSPTADEAEPDFILVFCASFASFAVRSIILGDYVVRVACEVSPYPLGIYVYTPADGKIYTLSQAYMEDVYGVREMVESGNVEYTSSVYRIGDVNKDGVLNIKDATLIQKKLASLVELEDSIIGGNGDDAYSTGICYSYADFNRDKSVNIKDATAIQKYLAGIKA